MTTVYADTYGFNSDDATTALQSAINDSTADKIIVRNMGNPWLISETIFLNSNKEIDFEPGVVVRAKSGTFLTNTKPLFRALSLDNVKLVGQGEGADRATLSMNKDEYTDNSSSGNQYGHIIDINGTNNYVVSGLTITGAGGDGININGADYNDPLYADKRTYSENGLIENVTLDNNRRQGMSVISAKGLVVQNSRFINTSGVEPSSGIDFEPDYNYQTLQNIQLSNVYVNVNNGDGISFAFTQLDNSSPSVSIDINGATVDRNNSGINVGTYPSSAHPNSNSADSTPNGTINISNTTITGTTGTRLVENQPSAAIAIDALSGDRSDPNNLKVNFDNVSISDTANTQFLTNPIAIRGFGGENNRQQVGNMSFNNVTVSDNFNRDIFNAWLGRADGYLSNVSGNITGINPNGVTSNFSNGTTAPQDFSLTVTNGTATPTTPTTTASLTLVNSTFDNGLTGWYPFNNDVSVVNRSGGSNWVKIAASGGGLDQDVTGDIVTGQSYIVGGTAQLSQTNDVGLFGVLFKDASGKITDIESINVTDSTSQYFQLGFTAPTNFAEAKIFAYKDAGTADLFIDDFSLFKQ
ncbi:hypothetical protein [Chamaesiphon sp. VAR_69_metabat_338]|uniref:hypothetical protein n=1 Tax=Chamaesiphon sp. VAR_69_metabat_338 TaxID=2964704 RepID=UPI00286E8284|nr:hypothetical protein [Chamaesiphon sp. VAR_69_metabat_338]